MAGLPSTPPSTTHATSSHPQAAPSTPSATLSESRSYHPRFKSPDADIVLSSLEGTLYRVPSFTLRNTCGYFRNLFSHPQQQLQLLHADNLEGGPFQPFETGEADKVVSKVLCMICGLPSDGWDSIQELEKALNLVVLWDAPGPLSLIRCVITTPIFLAHPLKLYGIAVKLGWDEEAKLASSKTLHLDLFDEELKPDLEKLPTKHLMALLRLHRRRRDELRTMLDGRDGPFQLGNSPRYPCPAPGCGEEISNHPWRELKSRIFYEVDKRPLGDTVVGLDMEDWPEAIACWSARCRRPTCGRLCYDKLLTLREIKKCIDKLPTRVE